MQKVSFLTSDNVKIIANWSKIENTEKYVILLHMNPATKESWDNFVYRLNQEGFSTLAIDLRGHGESTDKNGKKINYEEFPNKSHKDASKDVDAAINFLKEKAVKLEDIILIGGSIGANLAIDAMARYPEIKQAIALSPGLEYLEVTTDDKIAQLKEGQSIFLVSSKDDAHGSYVSTKKLHKLNKDKTKIKLYEAAGHATDMFAKQTDLMDELINWLKKQYVD